MLEAKRELKAGNKMEGAPEGYDPKKDKVLTSTPAYKLAQGANKVGKAIKKGLDAINPFKKDEDINEDSEEAHAELEKLVGQHFPVGQDGANAIMALKGLIDDEGLNLELQKIADEKGPDACGRPAVYKHLEIIRQRYFCDK